MRTSVGSDRFYAGGDTSLTMINAGAGGKSHDVPVRRVRTALRSLSHVLITGEPAGDGTLHLDTLLAEADDVCMIPPTDPEDIALLHFTSGTTGTPKGALHVHAAVVAHHMTGRVALDLHPNDVFWCTADPGWVTGISYGVIAPPTNGVTSIVDGGPGVSVARGAAPPMDGKSDRDRHAT